MRLGLVALKSFAFAQLRTLAWALNPVASLGTKLPMPSGSLVHEVKWSARRSGDKLSEVNDVARRLNRLRATPPRAAQTLEMPGSTELRQRTNVESNLRALHRLAQSRSDSIHLIQKPAPLRSVMLTRLLVHQPLRRYLK